MLEKLLTPEEAAERLSVSPKTLRDWLRAGTLKGIKAGNLWRVRESDLEAFLNRNAGVKASASRISARGILAHVPNLSSEAFMNEKHAELDEEERQLKVSGRKSAVKPRGSEAA